jgi:hypothetical protein
LALCATVGNLRLNHARRLEAPPGFEPGMEVCRQGRLSILLTRPVFWLALLPHLPWCSGAIVPKLFPRSSVHTGDNHRHNGCDVALPFRLCALRHVLLVQITGLQPTFSAALATCRIKRFAKRKSGSRPSLVLLANPSPNFTFLTERVGWRWLQRGRFGASQGQSWGQSRQSGGSQNHTPKPLLAPRRNERGSLVRQMISNDLTLTEL